MLEFRMSLAQAIEKIVGRMGSMTGEGERKKVSPDPFHIFGLARLLLFDAYLAAWVIEADEQFHRHKPLRARLNSQPQLYVWGYNSSSTTLPTRL